MQTHGWMQSRNCRWIPMVTAKTDRFGYSFDYTAQNTYNFIRSFGGDWVDPADGKTSRVDTEETVAAMAFMRSLVEDHKVSPTTGTDRRRQRRELHQPADCILVQRDLVLRHWHRVHRRLPLSGEDSRCPPAQTARAVRSSAVTRSVSTARARRSTRPCKWGKCLMGKDARVAAVKGGGSAPFLKEAWEDPFLADDLTLPGHAPVVGSGYAVDSAGQRTCT